MFLDIETTGLSHHYDEVTIVGWSLGGRSFTLVRGDDPRHLTSALKQAEILVTFNGTCFDLKFIRRDFPGVQMPDKHLDLMYLARQVGLTGGQKAIEAHLSIDHRNGLKDIDGRAAVLLWHKYLRGDRESLYRLITYNRADVASMGSILDAIWIKLADTPDLFVQNARFEDWSAPVGWREIEPALISKRRTYPEPPSYRSLLTPRLSAGPLVVGIDLTGSEARPSGWCALDGYVASTQRLTTDEQIIYQTLSCRPELVSIDSPLCLPRGRTSVFDDDPGRAAFGIMRESERELKRRGINVYPCLLPSMQRLTARGQNIARRLRDSGVPVIESYPGAAQDIMRIPRKGAGTEWLRAGLIEFGLEGKFTSQEVSHDELDAITSALVGTLHLAGLTEELGSADETPLIVPTLSSASKPAVIGLSGPLAAGKTTLSRFAETKGFVYTRFSQAVDDILLERGLDLNRANRQRIGAELNSGGRQRELAVRTLRKTASAHRIVVDGLRFPEDHAYLVERYGSRFFHVYVDAPKPLRGLRYKERLGADGSGLAGEEFEAASQAEVERQVPELEGLAHVRLMNDGGLQTAQRAMMKAAKQHFGDALCRSR